jgi:integrase/recombinase XerD
MPFGTVKTRVFQAIPAPPALLDTLDLVHGIRKAQGNRKRGADTYYLWLWSRTTAWRRVCDAMDDAGLEGVHASPKGLRHGVGVAAVQAGIPLNLVQRWLGHAQLSTTAIYADAVGPEEHAIAAKMWATKAP